MRNKLVLAATLTLAFTLSGCLFRPYEMQIQQGKIIDSTMIAKIKPGMSEAQVKYILGTPNIIDPYHPDTWYYIYTNQENHLPMAENQFIVHFSKNKLDTISGDYAPPTKLEYSQS